MPTMIGFQDLGALLVRQPGVAARAYEHIIASPFGTIHAATFSMPSPIGTAIPHPPLYALANFDPNEIREIFLHPKVTSRDDLDLEQKPADYEGLRSFLISEHDFSKERIDAALQRLDARKKVESQSLEQWFQ